MACGDEVSVGRSVEVNGKRECVPCFYNGATPNGAPPKEHLVELLEHIHDELLNSERSFDAALVQGAHAVTRLSELDACREGLALLMWIEGSLQKRKNELIEKILKLERS